MAKKKCEMCGRFMALTDLMPDESEFDDELAYECGLLPEDEHKALFDSKGYWSLFHYIQDQWECDNCNATVWHTEGQKHYWNPATGNYDGAKPLTPTEITALERQAQEAAGQARMFE